MEPEVGDLIIVETKGAVTHLDGMIGLIMSGAAPISLSMTRLSPAFYVRLITVTSPPMLYDNRRDFVRVYAYEMQVLIKHYDVIEQGASSGT